MFRLIATAAFCLALTGTAWAQSDLPPVSLEDMLETTPARDDAVVQYCAAFDCTGRAPAPLQPT